MSVNCKMRVKYFWENFMAMREELESALREEDEAQLEELRGEIDRMLEKVCGCKALIERNADGFFEFTLDTGPNKTVQYIAALIRQNAPRELVEDWIINAWLPPFTSKAANAAVRIKDHV